MSSWTCSSKAARILIRAAMWRALETEIGSREEVMAASALLEELIGPADEEAEAELSAVYHGFSGRSLSVRP